MECLDLESARRNGGDLGMSAALLAFGSVHYCAIVVTNSARGTFTVALNGRINPPTPHGCVLDAREELVRRTASIRGWAVSETPAD